LKFSVHCKYVSACFKTVQKVDFVAALEVGRSDCVGWRHCETILLLL